MKNILIKFFENKQKCTHKNALINQEAGYCPDCGQYLVKNYYIVRCSVCDIKREAKLYWGEIVPKEKYCTNCGATEYYIEKIDKINFIDAKYAIYLKEIANECINNHPEVQIWVDEGNGKIERLTKLSRNFI